MARAIYGPAFNPELTLKSLSYFGDGNLPTLPKDVQNRLIEVVRRSTCRVFRWSNAINRKLEPIEARSMKAIPLTAETEAIARRVIWFEEPRQALIDPIRFLA